MAKKWTNENMPGALFFVTGNVHNRRPVFRNQSYCRAFLNELQELRSSHQLKLIAFVLMPDHVHLILNPRGGDIQRYAGILKSLSAKRIVELAPPYAFWNGETNQVWQQSFKSLALWSGWMINQKINYIHANPVRDKLCSTEQEYPWTSFRSFYRQEADPLLSVDKEWWWEGDEDLLRVSVREWDEKRIASLAEEIQGRKDRLSSK